MPYTHAGWTLHQRDVVLKNGNGTQRIYFFAKGQPKSGNPTSLPRGYRVEISAKTGMPYVKKDPNAAASPQRFDWLRRMFN